MEPQETAPRVADPAWAGSSRVTFPADLASWTSPTSLLEAVRTAASMGGGDSWLKLVDGEYAGRPTDGLLILLCYGYLQGIYQSIDLLRRLETDENLRDLRSGSLMDPEQLRQFRRKHRRALTDCLTRSLLHLWRQRNPGWFGDSARPVLPRLHLNLLEPFYLQAQERIDRAIAMDSMSMDD